jgi:hypothetical protein
MEHYEMHRSSIVFRRLYCRRLSQNVACHITDQLQTCIMFPCSIARCASHHAVPCKPVDVLHQIVAALTLYSSQSCVPANQIPENLELRAGQATEQGPGSSEVVPWGLIGLLIFFS